MASIAQITANRHNSQFSTGARTEAGKAASSRNALTLGLYTRRDYVKPEERDLYTEFCETMYSELCPEGLLEQTLTSEITGASWRLRRCAAAEAELGDFDEATDKLRRSIERARSGAHSALHRSVNQIRRLQTDRRKAAPPTPAPDFSALIEPPADFLQDLDAILAEHAAPAALPEMASICKPAGHAARVASVQAPRTVRTPRNAECPCHSGQKYKRCCGRTAPAVLHQAA